MRILLIKQTSLGDVLHSTGHIRCVREKYPDAHLTLLTSDTAFDIYKDNPNLNRIIQFHRYEVKKKWLKNPGWTARHFAETFRQVNLHDYDLAIDLQGRWKSVLFLYLAKAKRKFVKGNWPLLGKFRDRSLHALHEMDGVLQLAGIPVLDHKMEFYCSDESTRFMAEKLLSAGLKPGEYVVLSPFTRWQSKNWSLDHYAELIRSLPDELPVVVSGAKEDYETTKSFLNKNKFFQVTNFCGKLSLQEFAELVRHSKAMVSGDSFAMHVASACNTPVVALFGPTDETRVAPEGVAVQLLRGNLDCDKCYKHQCPRRCIDDITTSSVRQAICKLTSSSSNFEKEVPTR